MWLYYWWSWPRIFPRICQLITKNGGKKMLNLCGAFLVMVHFVSNSIPPSTICIIFIKKKIIALIVCSIFCCGSRYRFCDISSFHNFNIYDYSQAVFVGMFTYFLSKFQTFVTANTIRKKFMLNIYALLFMWWLILILIWFIVPQFIQIYANSLSCMWILT